MKAKFSVFDNETKQRVSSSAYDTAEEANHDYHMNHGHTHVWVIPMTQPEALQEARRRWGGNASAFISKSLKFAVDDMVRFDTGADVPSRRFGESEISWEAAFADADKHEAGK